MANELCDLWEASHGLYGVEKHWAAARRAGHRIGRDQVARLMAIVGIEGCAVPATNGHYAARSVRRPPPRPGEDDLVGPAGARSLVGGRFHLCLDVRRLRLHQLRDRRPLPPHPRLDGLDHQVHFSRDVSPPPSATRRRSQVSFSGQGLVFHSDAGSQYTSLAFTEALVEAGIAPSIGSVGDALDNALMESTIGLYKTEVIHRLGRTWADRRAVERATAEWVQWFNTARLHSSIAMLPPLEYEAMYLLKAAFPEGEVA